MSASSIFSLDRRMVLDEKSGIFLGGLFTLLITVLSLSLTMQGWKSRVPAFDMLPYIYDAHHLLDTGTLPRFGDTGSYGSYAPPGAAWLMAPGVLLFSDPRLPEYVGAGELHAFTLLGLFLLARRSFGWPCAYLSVLLYGLSSHALFFAGSLWPIGHPVYYVWMVYFWMRWADRWNMENLAAGIIVWVLGMYHDLALLPAFFILPVLWLISKKKSQRTVWSGPWLKRTLPVLFAATAALFLWLPYLRFEAGRGFIDLRSQFFQQHIFPANYRSTWCDPSLTLQIAPAGNAQPAFAGQEPSGLDEISATLDKTRRFLTGWVDTLFAPFLSATSLPGAGVLLLLFCTAGMLAFSASLSSTKKPIFRGIWIVIPAGLILGGLMVGAVGWMAVQLEDQVFLGRTALALIQKLRSLLLFGGVGWLLCGGLLIVAGQAFSRVPTHAGLLVQSEDQLQRTRYLALSLAIPWWLLLILAEPGKPERFLWLFPLQILFIAAFMTNFLARGRFPHALKWAGLLAVAGLIVGNSFLLERASAWAKDGWSGIDAEEIQVVDSLSRQIQADGKDRASVGYQLYIYPFMANYNITNPVYKVGAHLDMLLLYRHGIVNTNQCAEGFAAKDNFRVVEVKPKPPVWSPRDYFSRPQLGRLVLVDQFGSFQIYRGPSYITQP